MLPGKLEVKDEGVSVHNESDKLISGAQWGAGDLSNMASQQANNAIKAKTEQAVDVKYREPVAYPINSNVVLMTGGSYGDQACQLGSLGSPAVLHLPEHAMRRLRDALLKEVPLDVHELNALIPDATARELKK